MDMLFDQIVVVYCNKDKQLDRLTNRNNINREKAKSIINSQISLKKKKKLADVVIYNEGSKKILKKEVLNYWREINED